MATTTTLTFPVTDTENLLDCASLASFPLLAAEDNAEIVVTIGSEQILCDRKDGNRLHAAVRGYNGTTAAAHAAAATVTLNEVVAAHVASAVKIGAITIRSGAGTPEAAVTGIVGDIFLRTDGSTSTTLYVKTSGTGNTGWTAK